MAAHEAIICSVQAIDRTQPGSDITTVTAADPCHTSDDGDGSRASMMLTRRHLLIGATSYLVSACSTPSTRRKMLDAQLDALYAALLQESPHNATAYGLDTGAHAALRTRWPERSRQHAERLANRYNVARGGLHGLADAGHDPEQRAARDATLFALDHALEGASFPYGDQTLMPIIDQEATPYPINQMIGLAA